MNPDNEMAVIQNEGNMSSWNIITRYLFGIFFFEVMTSFSCPRATLFPKMFCGQLTTSTFKGDGRGRGGGLVKLVGGGADSECEL